MDTSFSTLFFICCALIVSVWSQNCEQDHSERCLRQLLKFTDRGDLMFGYSPADLHTECVQAQAALGCLTRYSKKCLHTDEKRREEFADSISGPQKVTLGLCTEENNLKTRYLRNLHCLRNMSDGFQYCRDKYDRNQRDIALVEYEDKTHLQCCSFEGYRRCLRILTRSQNGCSSDDEVSDVIDEIAVRMGGALSSDACAEHAERCMGSGSHRTTTTTIMFIVTTLLCGLILV